MPKPNLDIDGDVTAARYPSRTWADLRARWETRDSLYRGRRMTVALGGRPRQLTEDEQEAVRGYRRREIADLTTPEARAAAQGWLREWTPPVAF